MLVCQHAIDHINFQSEKSVGGRFELKWKLAIKSEQRNQIEVYHKKREDTNIGQHYVTYHISSIQDSKHARFSSS